MAWVVPILVGTSMGKPLKHESVAITDYLAFGRVSVFPESFSVVPSS